MLKHRLIAVLILRDGQVVQSVRFKHTNVIHYDAIHAIEALNKWSVDEIVMLNVSTSEQSRDQFADVVAGISRRCFVPLSVGGWITNESYAKHLLLSGADKIVVNSILYDDPDLVSRLSQHYGSQCIVASIDVRHTPNAVTPTVHVDRGQRDTNQSPVAWAQHAVSLGVGEILFNSVDHDGARRGYDCETLGAIAKAVDVPVIAFGGVFRWEHLRQGLEAGADAVAMANQLHYTEQATRKAKRYLAEHGILVRAEGQIPSDWSNKD